MLKAALKKDPSLKLLSKTKLYATLKDQGVTKKEIDTPEPAWYLGKKVYCVHDGTKYKHVCRGIPATTIDEHGTRTALMDTSIYERVFKGESVQREYASMKRSLKGTAGIEIMRQVRTINPSGEYKTYY